MVYILDSISWLYFGAHLIFRVCVLLLLVCGFCLWKLALLILIHQVVLIPSRGILRPATDLKNVDTLKEVTSYLLVKIQDDFVLECQLCCDLNFLLSQIIRMLRTALGVAE